jgi:peptide methionine sulfoxide reductase msrA/msrB
MEILTPKERYVIEDKGTEAPFTGEYDGFFRDGLYVCRRCGALLYESKDKFDAHCGWPAFDDEIPGAVRRSVDADGQRTEITCTRCGAHLGHVFMGELLTAKDTRHCVNSLSMFFIPRRFEENEQPFAVFGGGCFWCTEAVFKELKGIISVTSGYAGGTTPDPTYEAVSTGHTGHAEVVKISYDPEIVTYADLLRIFFATHDPTTPGRQGHDIGTQYRSIILYKTLEQRDEALKILSALEQERVFASKIVTEVKPLYRFYEAEAYHQDYFAKHREDNPYCQTVINPKLTKLKELHSRFLKGA